MAELLRASEWRELDLDRGTYFIARDGTVAGLVQMVDVAPQTIVVAGVIVDSARRGEGIGRQLMQASMNAKGGTLYLCCHPERLDFYDHFGFTDVPFESLPEPVAEYFREVGDYPAPPGHEHHYLKAR